MKGSAGQTAGMKTAARLTATQRNRALGRLRTLTVGTALASTAATGAFGYLAVVTNPGTQVTGDSSTTAADAVTDTTSGSNSNSGSNAGSVASTPAAASGLQSATNPPTTTITHRRHATTGGS